jgi:small subunit ribosomal protein S2
MSRAGAADTDQKPADDQFSTTIDEPLPEWERDLLEGAAAAPAAEVTEEIQESPVTDEAVADAEIAAAAPEADAAAAAAAEAAPEAAAEAAEDAVEAPEAPAAVNDGE